MPVLPLLPGGSNNAGEPEAETRESVLTAAVRCCIAAFHELRGRLQPAERAAVLRAYVSGVCTGRRIPLCVSSKRAICVDHAAYLLTILSG